MKSRGRLILATLFALLLSATALWADDDPPGRVARLQYTAGSVSIQPEGTGDWVEGSLNRPLTITDNIWTDKNSRAELNVGTGILRMNDETSVTFTNLNDQTVQVELHQGTLSLHIRKLYNGEIYEIDTPNFAFTIQKSGDYRFDVSPEGDTSYVKVFKGEGYATGDGPAVRVRSEEEARFSNGTSLEHTFAALNGYDGFDDWGRVRDKRLDKGISAQYVSTDVIGYEDLDDYGYWRTVPDYGPIWVPSHVVTGWAPYRYGHWAYVGPWGWTWVDDSPWGFAPFHYGRWVYYNNYWGWAPGPRYVRPVYAPALVAWFGGSNWGVSLGFGGGPGYGWCPLGYGEPYVPWYRGSRNYFRNVNVSNTRITNITNVTNIYYNNPRGGGNRNFANLRGATAVSQDTIVRGRPVSGAIVNVSRNEFAKGPREGLNNLTPTRDSRLGGRQTVQAPSRSFARPVVSKLQAPVRNPETGGFNRGGVNNRPQSGAITARPAENNGPSIVQNPRGPEGNNNSAIRNVPRPGSNDNNRPNSGAITRSGGEMQGPNRPTNDRNNNVPRPPDRGNGPNSGAINNGGDRMNGSPRMGQSNNDSPRSGAIVNRPAGEQNSVPRPPDRGNGGGMNNNSPRMGQGNDSPRSGAITNRPEMGGGQNMPQRTQEQSAPRPPAGNNNAERGGGSNRDAAPQRNFSRQPEGGRTMSNPRNVPRPTGRILPAASRSVESRSPGSSGFSRGSQSNSMAPRSYAAPSRSYGMNSRSFDQPRSYQQRSYSSPSYSSPRYSAPSMSSGRSYSSPRMSGGGAPGSRGGGYSNHSFGSGGGVRSGRGR